MIAKAFSAQSNMLLVKCPKCEASYKLSEELYRRKAAGFGVVVTCRHCKTEIHVDEHGNAVAAPPAAADSAPDATTVPPAAVMKKAPPVIAPPTAKPVLTGARAEQTPIAAAVARAGANPPRPNAGPPRPRIGTGKIQTSPTAIGGLGPVMPTAPKQPPTPPAAPTAPSVPAAPGGGSPSLAAKRPPAKAAPSPPARPVRQPTLIGLRPPKDEPSSPKIVALSPGLLNVEDDVTRVLRAPQMPPPPPPVPPPPPEDDPVTLPPGADGASDHETERPPPLNAPDFSDLEELDLPIASEDMLPDSSGELPGAIDSKDFLEDLPKPKLPQAPPVRKLQGAQRAEAKDEAPSLTSAPKLEALVHDVPVKLSKAPKKPPAPSAPPEDDMFGESQGGFDNGPPPLAPPDAGALTRAPVSQRPQAPDTATKPSIRIQEKRRSRAIVWLLALAGLGVAGFFLRDRLLPPPPATPEPPKAPAAAAPAPAATPAPAETAEPAATTDPPPQIPGEPEAPTPPAAVATGTPTPAPAPEPPATGATPRPTAPTPTPTPTAAVTPKPTAASTPAPTPTPAPAPTAKPTGTTKIEPTPSVGTEPFDAAAARAALDAAAAQASSCRKEGDPSGVAVVTITYSPTGRVTTANIGGPPFAATATGGCIAATMRKARVPPFAGDMVTVRKTVTIN